VRRMLRGIDKRKRMGHFPLPLTHLVRYVLGRMPRGLYDAAVTRFVDRNKKPYVDESRIPQARDDQAEETAPSARRAGESDV